MTFDSPVADVKGVGPELAKKFGSVGVVSVGDLIDYLPRRYEDYSEVVRGRRRTLSRGVY